MKLFSVRTFGLTGIKVFSVSDLPLPEPKRSLVLLYVDAQPRDLQDHAM